MNQEVKVKQYKKIPWGAAGIFAAASLLVGFFALMTVETELGLESDVMAVAGIFGLAASLVSAIIDASLQYVFTKFPAQWIAKDKNVYQYDIWSAIFYSNAITLVLGLLIQQFNVQGSFLLSTWVSIVATGLFLFFYFSGEEKESHVKKAMIIVQAVLLALSIVFSIVALLFVNSLGV